MASGFSKRMKRQKLLLPIEDIPIIERVIKAVKASSIDEIIVIYQHPEIKKISEIYDINTIYNPDAHRGQSQAMKLGVKASSDETKGYMFFVGDQPFLNKNIINHLIDCFKENPCHIVVPLYNGQRGNPIIFPEKYKNSLLKIEGDQGGRGLIQEAIEKVRFVVIGDANIGKDIDTWQQYEKIHGGVEVNAEKHCGD